MTLVITGTEIGGVASDIMVAHNRIVAIEPHDPLRPHPPGAERVDGARTAALPGLMNGHTHTSMAIMRSYADDMPLMQWLTERIWPFERRQTREDVYWGVRLGCLEMIRTGTTFCNDMYWHLDSTARAFRDAGLRAVVSGVLIDMGDPERRRKQIAANERLMREAGRYGDRIRFALGPHAVYTVSSKALEWVAEQSGAHDLLVHMHLSETRTEVDECVAAHGMRPVAYAESLGLLSSRFLAAHAVHLTDDEISILADHSVHVLHNPVSNLKLASGGPMRYGALRSADVNVLLGTDGAASNNNLDLFEEMKFAALLAKHASGDPTILPAEEALRLATVNSAKAFRLPAGVLAPGMLADMILVDLDNPFLFPGHNLAADLVYSAHGRAVKTTICDGQVLMNNGVIPDEREIRREVAERLAHLVA